MKYLNGPPNTKLKSCAAFWKNDKPGGIGILFNTIPSDFLKVINGLLEAWESNAFQADMESQLQDIASVLKDGGSLSDKEAMVAFIDILWLERQGYLQSDEYNGACFTWRLDADVS